jgi:hypothetical protein
MEVPWSVLSADVPAQLRELRVAVLRRVLSERRAAHVGNVTLGAVAKKI